MGSFHCARVCTALLPLPAHARLLRLGRPASLLLLLLLLRLPSVLATNWVTLVCT